MTTSDSARHLKRFNGNPPAALDAIQRCQVDANFELPNDYIRFLRQCNGGEGFIGSTYIVLWRAEELVELNATYEIAKYTPGIFLFGSDGGGEALAFDRTGTEERIVSVPFVGMDLQAIRVISSSFDGLIQKLSKSE